MARRKKKKSGARSGGGARTKRSIPVRSEPDASELCLQCGLCCDGTLFAEIEIQGDERELVESLGLVVVENRDGPELRAPEPCPAFQDGCCSLYSVGRPATCGTYRCGLVEGYTGRTATLDECLAVVQLVWSLARELEVEMGLAAGAYTRSAVLEELERRRPWEEPAVHARFLVLFTRLNQMGDRYFRYKPRPLEVRAADSGAALASKAAAPS